MSARIRGFVVAGGRSLRMGRDKALLAYAGSTLLEHAIAKVRSFAPEIRILCGPTARYEDYGVPLVTDSLCGIGPLGALYSALVSASADGRDRIVWLAVDIPLVPPALLARLVSELDPAEITMARTERGVEPLCAAFQTEPTLAAVRRSVLQGRLKLTSALDGLNVRYIDGEASSFANINFTSEYEGVATGRPDQGQPGSRHPPE